MALGDVTLTPVTSPDLPQGGQWYRVDGLVNDLIVHVLVDSGGANQPTIKRVHVAGGAVHAEHLRNVPLGQIERRLRLDAHNVNDEPREPLTRRRADEDAAAFAQRVASTYRHYAVSTGRPAKAIADDSGLPVGTVHRWIREARGLGALGKGTQGRAG